MKHLCALARKVLYNTSKVYHCHYWFYIFNLKNEILYLTQLMIWFMIVFFFFRKCCEGWLKSKQSNRTLQTLCWPFLSQLEKEDHTEWGAARIKAAGALFDYSVQHDGAQGRGLLGVCWSRARPCLRFCLKTGRHVTLSPLGRTQRSLNQSITPCIRSRILQMPSLVKRMQSCHTWSWSCISSSILFENDEDTDLTKAIKSRALGYMEDKYSSGQSFWTSPRSKIQDKLHKRRECPRHQSKIEDGKGTGGTKGNLSCFYVQFSEYKIPHAI